MKTDRNRHLAFRLAASIRRAFRAAGSAGSVLDELHSQALGIFRNHHHRPRRRGRNALRSFGKVQIRDQASQEKDRTALPETLIHGRRFSFHRASFPAAHQSYTVRP
jgi:hypothetical protein